MAFGNSQPIRVLLIEDDPDDVYLVREILSSPNDEPPAFKLEWSDKLEEGIEMISNGVAVDVVVLDLTLPDQNGMETLVRMQTSAPNIPVVVFTALNDEASAIEALAKGAQDYLVKGHVSASLLSRTLRYAIERHRVRQELFSVSNELRHANERLGKLVLLDPLTELLNRRGLQDALSREVQWVKRDESDLMALILDLDDFKRINDTFGHAVGDVVLREIAQKLKVSLRITDYLARIGGDEFLALMPQTRKAEALLVAEKVRLALSGYPVALPGKEDFKITASFGLVEVAEDTVSVDDLLARTHHVLRKSKLSGKNKVCYDSGANEAVNAGAAPPIQRVLEDLKSSQRYQVVRQPIFNLQTGEKVGYEFLSRLMVLGFEMPDDFFRVSLENNMLTSVDHQCLRNCVNAGADLSRSFRRHLNIFPSTIIDIPIQHLINDFPKDSPRGVFCLELSEQQIIGDPSYLVEPIQMLKSFGILIAIDDVGFGRSCLESLILLEPDIVKIDKKWVHGITRNLWRRSSLERLLKVTEALGAEVVAEGIEAEEDLELLKTLGVRYGQGYLLGRPA